MDQQIPHFIRSASRKKMLPALCFALLASACAGPGQADPDAFAYRQSRAEAAAAAAEFRQCQNQAYDLDDAARHNASPAQYQAVVDLAQQCEDLIGGRDGAVDLQARMQWHAFIIQSQVKAGDIAGAQSALNRFEAAYPGRDLFYPDQSSFIDTMALLLGHNDQSKLSNARPSLKTELARKDHWTQN